MKLEQTASLLEKLANLPKTIGKNSSGKVEDFITDLYVDHFTNRNGRTSRVPEEVVREVIESVEDGTGKIAFNEVWDIGGSALGVVSDIVGKKPLKLGSGVVDYLDTMLTKGDIDAANDVYGTILERYGDEMSSRSRQKIARYRDLTKIYFATAGLLGIANRIAGILKPLYSGSDGNPTKPMKTVLKLSKITERGMEFPPIALYWLNQALEETIYSVGRKRRLRYRGSSAEPYTES